jgi:hypothetical protein
MFSLQPLLFIISNVTAVYHRLFLLHIAQNWQPRSITQKWMHLLPSLKVSSTSIIMDTDILNYDTDILTDDRHCLDMKDKHHDPSPVNAFSVRYLESTDDADKIGTR